MYRTRIKVCGMTREEDVIAASSLGVDAIGLIFYPKSPRYVSIEQAKILVAIAKPLTTCVGVFVNATPETITETIETTRIDILQFHGDEDDAFCQGFNRPYYKALRINNTISSDEFVNLIRQYPNASAILLDTYSDAAYGGTGETFDWSIVENSRLALHSMGMDKKIILAGGLKPNNVASGISMARPYAVDVNSGVETAPGIKDIDALTALVANVLQQDAIQFEQKI